MVLLGPRRWELHRGLNCGVCEPVPGLRERFWARQWLLQFKNDPAALYEIRRVLAESNTSWPLSKATTDQAIDWMAILLQAGVWHVHAPVQRYTAGAAQGENHPLNEEQDLADVVSTLSPLRERPESLPPRQEDGLLPRNADEEAIAAAMKLAAKLGIPFCEECARAALKRAREAA